MYESPALLEEGPQTTGQCDLAIRKYAPIVTPTLATLRIR